MLHAPKDVQTLRELYQICTSVNDVCYVNILFACTAVIFRYFICICYFSAGNNISVASFFSHTC